MKRARPKNKKARKIQESRMDHLYELHRSENGQDYDGKQEYPQNDGSSAEHDIYESEHDGGNSNNRKKRVKNKKEYREGSRQTGKNGRTKKKRKPLKAFFITLAALVVILFVAMGFGLFDESDILSPLEDGKINVLLLGVDEEGLRTDAIMIASYDVNAAQVNMLSVPRDTKVYVENRKVTRKINEVHAMSSQKKNGEILGAEATAEAVSQLTGIPINYYVEFSFSAIDHLFDILGPVEFDVPDVEGNGAGMNYDDPYQNLHIHLKPGLQSLSGNQVQQFLRYRKSNSNKSGGSDIERVARQQEFVKAVIDQKVNAALLVKLPGIYSQLSKEIKTNISAGDITKYIRYLNKLTGDSIHSYSLPGESKMISGGSYFVCNLEETGVMSNDIFGYAAEPTDKITLSESTSQKILKAGNMTENKKTSVTNTPNPTVAPKTTKTPEKSPSASAPTKSPQKTPESTPTKAPAVTKQPTKAPAVTKPPLEDMDDDFEVVEED